MTELRRLAPLRRVRRSQAVAAATLVALAACGGSSGPAGAPLSPAVQHHQINVDGLTRTYRLFVPLSLDRSRPAPLVLMLGGVGNTGESMVEATGFDLAAEKGEFIVAYPDGVNRTWNAGYCCLGRAGTGPDDVAFLGRLIDEIQASHNVDTARVFAVGVSVGGMMAYRLGCELAGRIAGVGSVAGAMILEECRPAKAVSVIEVHGTADGQVPYEGGHTAGGATQLSPPTEAVVQRWVELDRCPSPAAVQTQGPVRTSTWTGCATGTAVKLITIEGGGHTWFASGLGPVNGAVDATTEIWMFLIAARRS